MISSLELARLCGVSQGTVDRALHNRGRINPETRRRILAVAAEHGYVPNPAAREIMTGQSTLVGVVAPAITSIFFMDLMEQLRIRLREHGMRMLLAPSQDPDETVELLRDFAARRACAAVIVPPTDEFTVPEDISRALPIVSLVNPCGGDNVTFVGPDERSAGRMGVEYLASRGHRRILFLSYERRSWAMQEREDGYLQGMRRLQGEPCIETNVTDTSLGQAVEAYRPSAIFCHNDWLALSAIRHLGASGYRVPADISVMGIDNTPAFVALCPDITTLTYPTEAVAAAAASVLRGKRLRGRRGRFTVAARATVRSVG
ncbi:MAG: LacI family DNA-binding transcriptional regulator [Chitinivibrionales bacterium]|nr:LacI family DNA-binding transcriptional regulator [Chitinivibrionales bacterium]